ncbi:MAG: hypothetical protein M1831_000620 [Alyxoria varia]|nr:MAG: hypothetical protein M1831_000620 [Alyxoria varia]
MVDERYGEHGPLILGLLWVEFVLAMLLVMARVYTATNIVKDIGMDSPLAVATIILGLVSQAFLTVSVFYGLGNHSDNLSPRETSLALMWSWIAMSISIFAIALGKLVVIVFLLRIQGPTHRKKKWFLYFLAATNTFINLFETILVMLQCNPTRKLWQPDLPGNCYVRDHVNSISGFLQGAWNAASDLVLAVYPILLFGGLEIPLKLKLGVSCLMATGLFTAACAAVKTWEIRNVQVTTDATYALTPFVIWNWTELWVTLIAGSVAPLWPLAKHLFHLRTSSKYYSSRRNATGPSDYCGSRGWNSHSYTTNPERNTLSIPLKSFDGQGTREARQRADERSDSTEHIMSDAVTSDAVMRTTHVTVDHERVKHGEDRGGRMSPRTRYEEESMLNFPLNNESTL